MTDLVEAPSGPPVIDLRDLERERDEPRPSSGRIAPRRAGARPPVPGAMTARRITVLGAAWLTVTVVGVLLVLLLVGPLVQQRQQRALLRDFRSELVAAANAAYGLPGESAVTRAPAVGDPVAIIDSADVSLRQVVVEGVGTQQTEAGPGHVPGTAGPGQPGNAVVVGRRSLAGGPFRSIGDLEVGDRILVTTTQGQSVYVVGHVGTHEIVESSTGAPVEETVDMYADAGEAADPTADPSEDEADGDGSAASEADDEPLLAPGPVSVEELQGPTDDDRLTLITSASGNPFATGEAQVVVAEMDGIAFTPTPQGGRTATADGRHADGDAAAPIVLALLAYAGAVALAFVGYRRIPWRGAYLVSAPPLVAATMLLAEQLLRLVPAWA